MSKEHFQIFTVSLVSNQKNGFLNIGQKQIGDSPSHWYITNLSRGLAIIENNSKNMILLDVLPCHILFLEVKLTFLLELELLLNHVKYAMNSKILDFQSKTWN